MESFGILYCPNIILTKYEMPLFNRYVWDKIRPSNGGFVAQKLKVFFKLFKNPTIPIFFAE